MVELVWIADSTIVFPPCGPAQAGLNAFASPGRLAGGDDRRVVGASVMSEVGDFVSKIFISLLIHLERLGIRATLRFAGAGSDTGVIGAEKTGVIRVTCQIKHMTRTSPLSLGGDIHVTTFPFFFGVCPCSLPSLFNLLYFLT